MGEFILKSREQMVQGIPMGKLNDLDKRVKALEQSGGGSGTPATSVTDETTYGITPAVGISTDYARADHTHGTPTTPTKSTVGLGNVDNTSDANKPVSTATQTALNAKQDELVLTTTGSSGPATLIGSTLNIPQYSGGPGGSLTKGIAEVDFGANTSESDIATVTVADAAITSTSYPSVSLYSLATADHDSDDYMAEGLIPYVTNVVNGVSFDISVRAPNLTFGKYKVTYQY